MKSFTIGDLVRCTFSGQADIYVGKQYRVLTSPHYGDIMVAGSDGKVRTSSELNFEFMQSGHLEYVEEQSVDDMVMAMAKERGLR